MPWTETTRHHHDRRALRYASDCIDREWEALLQSRPPLRALFVRDVECDSVCCGVGLSMAALPGDFPREIRNDQ